MTTHDEAVAMVSLIYAARATKRDADVCDKILTATLKQYLEDSGDLDAYDGESGLIASLQSRSQAGTLDLVALAQAAPDLLLELAQAGALKADIKAVSASTRAADAAPYLIAGGTTTALIITVER